MHFAFCISGVASTLDSFDDISRWKAVSADGVELKLSQDEGRRGPGLRIDFDFHRNTRDRAAVDEAWLTAGVTIDGLSTHSGVLGYTMHRSGDEVTIDFSRVPTPSAVIIRSPLEKPIRAALADGVAVKHGEHEVRLTKVPRHIVLQY